MAKRKTPEGQIKAEIDVFLSAQPECVVFPYFVSGFKNYKSPNKVGTPDRLVCYRGRFIGFEVKAPGGKPSKEQVMVAGEIHAAGGSWFLVRSVEDVAACLLSL